MVRPYYVALQVFVEMPCMVRPAPVVPARSLVPARRPVTCRLLVCVKRHFHKETSCPVERTGQDIFFHSGKVKRTLGKVMTFDYDLNRPDFI